MLTDADRRELFATTEHRAAAEVFAQRADLYQIAETGAFTFLAAPDMALTLSMAAVQKALKYHTGTAQALAKLVTLPVGSKRHQAAITLLINLIHHLSPKVRD
jgi:hypothetical protein